MKRRTAVGSVIAPSSCSSDLCLMVTGSAYRSASLSVTLMMAKAGLQVLEQISFLIARIEKLLVMRLIGKVEERSFLLVSLGLSLTVENRSCPDNVKIWIAYACLRMLTVYWIRAKMKQVALPMMLKQTPMTMDLLLLMIPQEASLVNIKASWKV